MMSFALLKSAARFTGSNVTSDWFRYFETVLLQYVMLLDGFPQASHGTVKLESGVVTHAYSAMSQFPAELLSGPEPNRTFGGTSRIVRSTPIPFRFSL